MSGKKHIVTMFPGSKSVSVGDFEPKSKEERKKDQENNDQAANEATEKRSKDAVMDDIMVALKNIYDPEIPLNIYDLGLIYNVELDDDYVAYVDMTLTSPGCPVAQTFPIMIEQRVSEVTGVSDAEVNL
jgi:Predicted metal-sulfur cluster biosynthetic enzyme